MFKFSLTTCMKDFYPIWRFWLHPLLKILSWFGAENFVTLKYFILVLKSLSLLNHFILVSNAEIFVTLKYLKFSQTCFHLCVWYCVTTRTEMLVEGNHYLLLHQPQIATFVSGWKLLTTIYILEVLLLGPEMPRYPSSSFVIQPKIDLVVSLNWIFMVVSYFMSSALVCGKEWLASISKMLLTKTLGLKKYENRSA